MYVNMPSFFRFVALLGILGLPLGSLFGSLRLENGDPEKAQKRYQKRVMREIREIPNGRCLPLKKRIFDPLLPQRLAEYAMASNTPCVPEGRVADKYIYTYIRHRASKAHRACLIQCQILQAF